MIPSFTRRRSLVQTECCFHCQSALDGPQHRILLRTESEEVALPLCEGCQEMRRAGQLPIEMLLQQWYYSLGRRDLPGDLFFFHRVVLDCLGCGAVLHSGADAEDGARNDSSDSARRMPDGSIVLSCPSCERTNVLEGRGGQLVTVRLW